MNARIWAFCSLFTDPYSLTYQIRIQCGAQIPFPKRGDDHHDQLASVFGPPGHLQGGPGGCPGGNSYQQAFFFGHGARGGEGILGFDADNFIVNLGVEDSRDKPGPNALQRVGTLGAARKDRRSVRFDRDRLEAWQAKGGKTLEQKARERAAVLLAGYGAPPLPKEISRELDRIVASADQELAGKAADSQQ